MKLTYTLSFTDFKAAQRLHIRQKLSRHIRFIIVYNIIPALTVVMLVASAVFLVKGQAEPLETLLPLDAGLLIVSVGMPIARFFNFRKCYKQLFPPTRKDRSTSIDIDDERILSTIPGVAEGKLFWTGLLAYAQNYEMTLFYTSENRFLPVPTYTMSPEQRTELNDLVIRHLPEGKR
jgi:hypothetical protein